jgi:hypothetical protein
MDILHIRSIDTADIRDKKNVYVTLNNWKDIIDPKPMSKQMPAKSKSRRTFGHYLIQEKKILIIYIFFLHI